MQGTLSRLDQRYRTLWPLSPAEEAFYNLPPLVRLGAVSVHGVAPIHYPTWSENRRHHCRGAMYWGGQFALALHESLAAVFPDAPERHDLVTLLRVAAATHDVGHAPFSHFAEDVHPSFDHEEAGRTIITSVLGDAIRDLGIDPLAVAWLVGMGEIDGYTAPAWLRPLRDVLHGAVNADTSDWVLRDQDMAGCTGDLTFDDIAGIVSTARIVDGRIAFRAARVPLIQRFVTTRVGIYTAVAHDPHVRALQAVARRELGPLIEAVLPDRSSDVQRLLHATDRELLALYGEAQQPGSSDPVAAALTALKRHSAGWVPVFTATPTPRQLGQLGSGTAAEVEARLEARLRAALHLPDDAPISVSVSRWSATSGSQAEGRTVTVYDRNGRPAVSAPLEAHVRALRRHCCRVTVICGDPELQRRVYKAAQLLIPGPSVYLPRDHAKGHRRPDMHLPAHERAAERLRMQVARRRVAVAARRLQGGNGAEGAERTVA